jgi:hypothetical protein
MGYTTDFSGELEIYPEITPEHRAYINQFSNTRRMKRNPDITLLLEDPYRDNVDLEGDGYYGVEGGYFVNGDGVAGQARDASIIDYNSPPLGQPGLWCQWVVNDYNYLEWDGGEKFYNYTEWLDYLIEHFFEPWGYTLN